MTKLEDDIKALKNEGLRRKYYKSLSYAVITKKSTNLTFEQLNEIKEARGYLDDWLLILATKTGRLDEYKNYLNDRKKLLPLQFKPQIK